MDTISISINAKTNKKAINVLQALEGNKTFKPSLSQGNIRVRCKISYPKFHCDSNAYLITSIKEVLKVHEELWKRLKRIYKWEELLISINRVDIPFTIWMKDEETFHSYLNVFKYAQEIFSINNYESSVKGFEDFTTGNKECIYYNEKGSYNRNIKIYNQHKKFEDKYSVTPNYGDLENRVRIEYSRRVKGKRFTVSSFKEFDIFSEYFDEAKNYICKNAFNLDLLQEIQEKESEELYQALMKQRQGRNFNYRNFINTISIKSYEPIQAALKRTFPEKIKSYESAITEVRKAIKEKEVREGIQILNTTDLFKQVIDSINDIEIL